MGSGRGQTRRARTTTIPVPAMAPVDRNAWLKFVLPQGIGMMTVSEYYGVRKVELLAHEIIRDMEAIGSFVLPAGASMDDFHVYIANDRFGPDDDRRGNFLFIRRTFPNGKRPRARVWHSEPRLFIKPYYKMGTTLIYCAASSLASAMAVLIAADGTNSDTILTP